MAFAELVSYIEELQTDEDIAPGFKLADLNRLYSSRLEKLGLKQYSRVHSTKLKNRILSQFSDLNEYKEGRHILLAFDKDIGLDFRTSSECNYDEDAICLSKATEIVRKDMLQLKGTFKGSFEADCHMKAVPKSLLALVGMILEGPNIKLNS